MDRAISDYDRAIQLKPDYAEAYNNRGSAYAYKGDLDRAINDWNQAIQIDPNSPTIYFNIGQAYNYKGDSINAINAFKKAVEVCGDNSELCQAAHQWLQQLGGE